MKPVTLFLSQVLYVIYTLLKHWHVVSAQWICDQWWSFWCEWVEVALYLGLYAFASMNHPLSLYVWIPKFTCPAKCQPFMLETEITNEFASSSPEKLPRFKVLTSILYQSLLLMPQRVINPILFLPSSMSIYSPLLSAELNMFRRSMYSSLQVPQPLSSSWGISAAYLSLRKGSLGHVPPTLACMVRGGGHRPCTGTPW